MATITANNGAAGNWTLGTTWVGGTAPTAADDAVIGAGTTSITIDAGALCRSADFTGCTGTITMGESGTLTIGDGTAGAGNIALKMPAGMTFAPTAGSVITFVSTSSTLQTIACPYAVRNFTFNSSSNGNYALTANLPSSTCSIVLTKGTLHMDGTADNSGLTHALNYFSSSNSNVRALNLGAATITVTGGTSWNISTSTNMTLTRGTSVISSTGSAMIFEGGGLTYNEFRHTGAGTVTVSGTNTFAILTRTGTAVKTDELVITNAQTVTGTVSINGNSATNRVLFRTSSVGSAVSFTSTGATLSMSNVDLRDINSINAIDLSAITGGSGDCGGNKNVTFTTAVTRYAVAAGNWSSTSVWSATDGGSSGATVPLPQDAVNINGNSGVGTITVDMYRLGKNITYTGYTGTAAYTSNNVTMYGNLVWGSSMTISGTNTLTFEGRGTHTITSNGKTFTQQIDFQAPGGTYTLQDAFVTSSALNGISRGTFDANNFNVTATTILISSSSTRTINMGSGTWTATSTGNVWNATTTTGLTLNRGTSTISITDTSASAKTFIGGGKTYYNVRISGSGAGTVTFTGANTLNQILVIGGTKSIVLPGSTTTTIQSGVGLGNGTNVITFTASSGSATISKSAGTLAWNYVSLTNIPSTGGATFYAGTNSTNGGGNTGWIFTDAIGSSGATLSVIDSKREWLTYKGFSGTVEDMELSFYNTMNNTTFLSDTDAKERFFLNLGYTGTLDDMYYKALIRATSASASTSINFSIVDLERVFYSNVGNNFI